MTWGSRACTSSARPAPRMAEASRWMRQLTLEGPKKPSSVAIALGSLAPEEESRDQASVAPPVLDG